MNNEVKKTANAVNAGIETGAIDAALNRERVKHVFPIAFGEIDINAESVCNGFSEMWKQIADVEKGGDALLDAIRVAFDGVTDFAIVDAGYTTRSVSGGVESVKVDAKTNGRGVANQFAIRAQIGSNWVSIPHVFAKIGVMLPASTNLKTAKLSRARLRDLIIKGKSWEEVRANEKAKNGAKLTLTEENTQLKGKIAELEEMIKKLIAEKKA